MVFIIKKQLFILTTILSFFGLSSVVANASTYTVRSGDTVSKIAKKYHDTIKSIGHRNNLDDVNMIFVGQRLQVGKKAHATKKVAKHVAPVANTANANQATTSTQQSTTQPTTSANTATDYTPTSGDSAAKAWIAQRESSNSYTATNGKYIGKYQLDAAYLKGDYSAANQEKVANQYVANRYGSWSAAQSFWQANGWY